MSANTTDQWNEEADIDFSGAIDWAGDTLIDIINTGRRVITDVNTAIDGPATTTTPAPTTAVPWGKIAVAGAIGVGLWFALRRK